MQNCQGWQQYQPPSQQQHLNNTNTETGGVRFFEYLNMKQYNQQT